LGHFNVSVIFILRSLSQLPILYIVYVPLSRPVPSFSKIFLLMLNKRLAVSQPSLDVYNIFNFSYYNRIRIAHSMGVQQVNRVGCNRLTGFALGGATGYGGIIGCTTYTRL
jgi:hypothetical protein